MNFFDGIKLALKSVVINKFKSIISILLICVGICAIMVITTLGLGSSKEIFLELDKVGMTGVSISPAFKDDMIDSDTFNFLRENIKGDQKVIPIIKDMTFAVLKEEVIECFFGGGDLNFTDYIDISLLYGRMINQNDIDTARKVVVIDNLMAKKIYKRENIVGKTLKIQIKGVYEEFEIVGVGETSSAIAKVMMSKGTDMIFAYVPYTTVSGEYQNGFNLISIKSKSNNYAEVLEVVKRIDDGTIKIENGDEYKAAIENVMGILTLLIGGVGGISLFVGGFGIMAIMLSSVTERKKEIGIKKAIGATQGNILFEFLIEALTLSVIGGAIGVVLGWIVSYLVASLLKFEFIVPILPILISIILSVIIGVMSGIVPANMAAKLPPLTALSSE